jgi:hypothetical protein
MISLFKRKTKKVAPAEDLKPLGNTVELRERLIKRQREITRNFIDNLFDDEDFDDEDFDDDFLDDFALGTILVAKGYDPDEVIEGFENNIASQ